MKTEKLKIGEREYIITELKYKDVAQLQDLEKSEAAKKMMLLSTNITEEEYNELGMADGIKLMKIANKLNDIDTENFQKLTQ
jgi:hypothetical protein